MPAAKKKEPTEPHPRKAVLDGVVKDYSPEELDKHIDLAKHRFIAVESIKSRRSSDSYLTGHPTLRAACEFLESPDTGGYKPECIFDLDTGEKIELDVITKVVPQSVQAVVAVLPMAEAKALAEPDHHNTNAEVDAQKRALKRLRAAIDTA